jgi:two-component system, NarL family, nitrate/nitrite response regulator NarL
MSRADSRRIRVLIVEDHEMVADSLARILEAEHDIEVVGIAHDVRGVRAFRGRVDVVLMDYALPDGSGADATRIVKDRTHRTRVVMVTGLTDDEHMLDSIHAGADGYLTKNRTVDDVVAAVRAAHAGEMLLPPSVIGTIAKLVATGDAAAMPPRARPDLTAREHDVLAEMVAGRGSDEICRRLGIGRNTLRSHIDHLLAKLEAHSRVQAVTVALADPQLRATLFRDDPDAAAPSVPG